MIDKWAVDRNAGLAYGEDYRQYMKLWYEQLAKMPTIRQNIGTGVNRRLDLKIEEKRVQVWIGRDWAPSSEAQFWKNPDAKVRNGSTMTAYIYVLDPDGTWVNVDQFEAKHLPSNPWDSNETERLWQFEPPAVDEEIRKFARDHGIQIVEGIPGS